jgi:IstB-like ATP binding protein
MERTQLFDLMGELKLYGMKAAFDEIMATAVKRQHEPQRIVGDLLTAEVNEKQARSIKYQLTIAKLPLAKDLDDFRFQDTPINETLVRDLAGGDFIAQQRNAVLVGGTGAPWAGNLGGADTLRWTRILRPRPGRLACVGREVHSVARSCAVLRLSLRGQRRKRRYGCESAPRAVEARSSGRREVTEASDVNLLHNCSDTITRYGRSFHFLSTPGGDLDPPTLSISGCIFSEVAGA